MKIPRVLIIAGSDSGGGAGIQADLKTVSALGAFGMTAITALTAQNTTGVYGVLEIEPKFVVVQIEACVSDIGCDAVVEPLITVFKDYNLPVRWYAGDALGRIGKPAMKALLLAIRGEVGGETVRPIVLNMRARSFAEQTLIHLGANAVGPHVILTDLRLLDCIFPSATMSNQTSNEPLITSGGGVFPSIEGRGAYGNIARTGILDRAVLLETCRQRRVFRDVRKRKAPDRPLGQPVHPDVVY